MNVNWRWFYGGHTFYGRQFFRGGGKDNTFGEQKDKEENNRRLKRRDNVYN